MYTKYVKNKIRLSEYENSLDYHTYHEHSDSRYKDNVVILFRCTVDGRDADDAEDGAADGDNNPFTDVINRQFKNLSKGHSVLIVPVKKQADIVDAFSIPEIKGKNIKCVCFLGHGLDTSVKFSKHYRMSCIDGEADIIAMLQKHLTVDDSKIVFYSCDTGADSPIFGSVARFFAKKMGGVKVYAPYCSINRVKFIMDKNGAIQDVYFCRHNYDSTFLTNGFEPGLLFKAHTKEKRSLREVIEDSLRVAIGLSSRHKLGVLKTEHRNVILRGYGCLKTAIKANDAQQVKQLLSSNTIDPNFDGNRVSAPRLVEAAGVAVSTGDPTIFNMLLNNKKFMNTVNSWGMTLFGLRPAVNDSIRTGDGAKLKLLLKTKKLMQKIQPEDRDAYGLKPAYDYALRTGDYTLFSLLLNDKEFTKSIDSEVLASYKLPDSVDNNSTNILYSMSSILGCCNGNIQDLILSHYPKDIMGVSLCFPKTCHKRDYC